MKSSKFFKRPIMSLLAAAAMTAVTGGVANAACGTVSIAEMNWASAQAAARVDEFILKNGYGCNAETVPGDTMPTATSMTEKGRPDIAPELWMNSILEPIQKAVKEKRLVIVGDVLQDTATNAGEGWWIPTYMLEKNPELATIAGIKKNAALFKDPEDPTRGRVVGCPAGWACQISTANLFKAFEMEKAGFNLVDPGSGAALSGAITKAYNRQEPILAYYWAPTALLSKLDMTRVDLGPHDQKAFENCIGLKTCTDPKPNSFAVSEIKTVVSSKFADNQPEAMAYLTARVWPMKDFGAVLQYMQQEQANGQDAAIYFLKTYPETWKKWVSADAAAKIQSALK
jgi:glycine betaine/proline transport system substrate-binding protein